MGSIFNSSNVEDVFADENLNNTETFEDSLNNLHTLRLFETFGIILTYIIGSIALTSDSLIIATIKKFTSLRNRPNWIIFNMSICHIIFMVFTPVVLLFYALLVDNRIDVEYFCIMKKVEDTALILFFIFITLLAFDFYVTLNCEKVSGWLKTYFKLLVVAIYGVVVSVSTGFTLVECFYPPYMFHAFVRIALVSASLSTIIVYGFVWYKNRELVFAFAKSYSLAICLFAVLCWFPLFLGHLAYINGLPGLAFYYIFKNWAYAHPLIKLVILMKHCKYFEASFFKMFKCCRSKNIAEENFEDESSLVDSDDGRNQTQP